MESQISYIADGTTKLFYGMWHNEPFTIKFIKAPPKGTIITLSTRELDYEQYEQ